MDNDEKENVYKLQIISLTTRVCNKTSAFMTESYSLDASRAYIDLNKLYV